MSKTTYVEGRLGYNSQNDRYGLLESDLWVIDGFHCGDVLEIWNGSEWVVTRIEMATGGIWYLVDTDYRGNDLEYLRARVDRPFLYV